MNRSLSVFRQVEDDTPNSVADKPSEGEYIRLRLGTNDIITEKIKDMQKSYLSLFSIIQEKVRDLF
jgi:hypothetical protein